MAEIDEVIEQHGGWPGAFVTKSTDDPTEEEQAADTTKQVGTTSVSPEPPTSSPASKAVEPQQSATPHNPASNEEKELILAALDQASEALGTPLFSIKTKIDRWRLEEILPILVHQGLLKQSGTSRSARYSRS